MNYKSYETAQIGQHLQPLREDGPGRGLYQLAGLNFQFDCNQGRPLMRSEPAFPTRNEFEQ